MRLVRASTTAVRRSLRSLSTETDSVRVKVHVPRENRSFMLEGRAGQSIKDLTEENAQLASLLECACGGIAACSTCHVIVHPEHFPRLPPIEDYEQDMVDLAWGPTDTSRLGCQIVLQKHLDGLVIEIPRGSNNLH